ncbi:hypothetical protein [Paenibacillus koleovorans]|uniref:hypothetical protein n=1 Tax=Paenibacillus koleovorans TaxID=121608 RepID=UPI000FDBD257|nr:hypothetical protein [Paenibacillus koleovorans]
MLLRWRTGIAIGATKLILGLGVLFYGWMTIQSFINSGKWFDSHGIVLAWVAAAASLFVLADVLMSRFLPGWRAIAFVLGLAFALRLVWILTVNTQPVSDFLDMYSAAQSAAVGDFSFGTNDYFTRWVYQLGFALYEGFILYVSGDHMLVLKLLNVALNTATVYLVYAMAALSFGERSGRIAGLAMAVYAPQIMMGSVLTNQHISTFFFFLGLYLVMRGGGGLSLGAGRMAGEAGSTRGERFSLRYGWWVAAGLCLGLANWMRPMGSLFVLAFLCYAVMYLLWGRGQVAQRMLWKRGLRLAIVVVVYVVMQQGASLALQATGVTAQPLHNPEPYWKFMVGLNPVTNGGWSQEDTEYVLQFPQGDERNAAERQLMLDRLADREQVQDLLVRKLKLMWGAEDSAYMWSLWEQHRPDLQQQLIRTERVQAVTAAWFGLVAMLVLLVRGTSMEETRFTLPLMLLLGFAAIHAVIEIQTRYRMDVMPALMALHSLGAICLVDWGRKMLGKF